MTDAPVNLRDFLLAWHEWATSGAPRHPQFSRSAGLCLCYLRWSKENHPEEDPLSFCDWFVDRWGGFPFDGGRRALDLHAHTNPLRLQWVKDQLFPRPERFDDFLKDWLGWAEAGFPSHKFFDSDFGLCYNYSSWAYAQKLNSAGQCYAYMGHNAFDEAYPFGYDMDKRIAWVKKELNNAL